MNSTRSFFRDMFRLIGLSDGSTDQEAGDEPTRHRRRFFPDMIRLIGLSDGPTDQEAGDEPTRHRRRLDWSKIIAMSSWPVAIDIALSLHSQESQLPVTFYFLALAIIFANSCVFVSNFIHSNYPVTAQVLERLGIFFGLTAFFIAITIPFPLWFKCVTCFIYVLSWSAILFCNYCNAS